MGIDGAVWLERHRKGYFVPDRTRPLPIEEKLEPGDVGVDGSILSAGGFYIVVGAIWLTETKAKAASYYGWWHDGRMSRCVKTCEPLFMMIR